MSILTIEDRVKYVICNELGIVNVTGKEKISDFCEDSLDEVELVMFIEDEFDIAIPDEDCEKFETVQNVIDYVSGVVKS